MKELKKNKDLCNCERSGYTEVVNDLLVKVEVAQCRRVVEHKRDGGVRGVGAGPWRSHQHLAWQPPSHQLRAHAARRQLLGALQPAQYRLLHRH